MRLVPLVLAAGLLLPARARARDGGPSVAPPPKGPPPVSKGRRAQPRLRGDAHDARSARSPDGRHVVTAAGGAILLDGRRVRPEAGAVVLLGEPVWRADGGAVAWLERGGGETRLVVLAGVEGGEAAPLTWRLPRALAGDRVVFAGPQRVHVGPDALEPRAVARWEEEARP